MRASVFVLLAAAACGHDTPPARAHDAAPVAHDGCAIASRTWEHAAPKRLVAIGDLHGDLGAALAALKLAGAIDDGDRWIGGDLAIVQTGDLLDRGDGEQAIVDLFERLERDAAAAGGSFTWLLGNHELMNANGDYRYVTPGGWRDFADAPGVDVARPDDPEIAREIAQAPEEARARAAAFLPGGAYAKILAEHDVAAKFGDTVFAHAGFLPTSTADPAAMNRAARCWLADQGPAPDVARDPDGPVWTRAWGGGDVDCAMLHQVLSALGAQRMVVAHTVQQGGINSACDGALWRIDSGMTAVFGGPVEALELTPQGARVLGPATR